MKNSKFWLIIDPYVYISIKANSILFYNTLNGKEVLYRNEPGIIKLTKKLLLKRNMMVLGLSENYIRGNERILKFIKKIKRNFMGDLIESNFSSTKPIQFIPEIKIQSEIIRKKEDKNIIGQNLMLNLDEISIYINNQCVQNCSICNYAYKQFLFCQSKSREKEELKLAKIKDLIKEIQGSSINRINILGGNILLYSKIKQLASYLNEKKIMKSYYIHYLNLFEYRSNLPFLNGKMSELNILITHPIKEEIFSKILTILKNYKFKINYNIENEKDVELTNIFIQKSKIDDFSLLPCYNKKNLSFFKNNVFIKKNQIFESKPSMKSILKRGVINTFFWGEIFVLSNGNIYANLNNPSIGKLEINSLYEIVYKEMEKGKSWRKLRKNVKPCRKCVYENLCPPISNYEYTIGQNNLCHIYK